MKKVSREKFEELKQKHYELWDWLSKHPDKSKDDWFKLDENRGLDINCNCFACYFDDMCGENNCAYCPICKNREARGCLDGLYEEYTSAKANYRSIGGKILKKRVIGLTKQIRDLPWSEEYVEDKEMNNENYIVINGKKAELTEEQLRQLGIEVDKDKRWRAEGQGMYYFVTNTGRAGVCHEWLIEADNFRYDTHNYFKTEEEAQEYADVLEIKRQLIKFADEHNKKIDWKDSQALKWYLYCGEPTETIVIGYTYYKHPETVYFSSKELVQQAVKEIGEENIIKYLTYEW